MVDKCYCIKISHVLPRESNIDDKSFNPCILPAFHIPIKSTAPFSTFLISFAQSSVEKHRHLESRVQVKLFNLHYFRRATELESAQLKVRITAYHFPDWLLDVVTLHVSNVTSIYNLCFIRGNHKQNFEWKND